MHAEVSPARVALIGGTGRSGTNILKDILARAPEAAALPFETRFTVDPDGIYPSYRALRQPLTPFEAHRVLARLERLLGRMARRSTVDRAAIVAERMAAPLLRGRLNLRAYKEWELEAHLPGFTAACTALIEGATAGSYTGIWPGRPGHRARSVNRFTDGRAQTRNTFSAFLNRLFDAFAGAHGAQVVIDDNTYNIFFAPEALELMAGAHLVHMVRDPRDVVASFLTQRWTPRDVPGATAFYAASMQNCIRATDGVAPKRLTTLRLEDLCRDPAATLAPLCKTLGLSLTGEMTGADLSRANAGRWRRDIPAEQHGALTRALAPYIERFGYDA